MRVPTRWPARAPNALSAGPRCPRRIRGPAPRRSRRLPRRRPLHLHWCGGDLGRGGRAGDVDWHRRGRDFERRARCRPLRDLHLERDAVRRLRLQRLAGPRARRHLDVKRLRRLPEVGVSSDGHAPAGLVLVRVEHRDEPGVRTLPSRRAVATKTRPPAPSPCANATMRSPGCTRPRSGDRSCSSITLVEPASKTMPSAPLGSVTSRSGPVADARSGECTTIGADCLPARSSIPPECLCLETVGASR